MSIKKTKLITTTLLASLLVCSVVWVNQKDVEVVNAATTTYPFATGENALKYAPTVTAPASLSAGDNWMFYEQKFDADVNLSSATYIAVEFKLVTGTPGLTVGVLSNGSRFGTYGANGRTFYFVSESGNVTEYTTMYDSINLAANSSGMILMPINNFGSWVVNAPGATLGVSQSIFVESNNKYNCSFSFKIGEIGYYTGDPFNGASMTKLLDLSTLKKDKYYSAVFDVSFPEITVDENNIAGQTATYPFTTQDNTNAMIWAGPTSQDANDNWQTLKVKFDEVADLTNATYIAIEYYSKSGQPGLTYGVENNGTRYSIVGSSGNDVYVMNQAGAISKATGIANDAVTTNVSGCLLIPMDYFALQFGNEANTLAAAQQMTFATNSKYNYNFEVMIGEIGYYTGRIKTNDFTFHKLVDLSSSAKIDSYSVSADNASNGSKVYRNFVEKMVYGDTTLVYTATGKSDNSVPIWEGGANGKQTMTKDSYGDDALLLESLGPRAGADAYTAYNLMDGCSIDWSNAQGVTFWARNDSDAEISFNLEIDAISDKTPNKGRFNVKQGNRFWLYDVNTDKQTIYMTRPCITLPVGFEGWVRVPFEAFSQAEWSFTDPNYGTFAPEYFMSEGCIVPYIGLTVFSTDYTNKPFAINKLGGYTTTPSFVSALVPVNEERKDIKTLMGLN